MDKMKDYELSRDLQNTKSIKKPFSIKDAENMRLENVIKGMRLSSFCICFILANLLLQMSSIG